MNLRPHHLLCIQKFTGHGYSPEFTAHMTAVAARLRKMPETRITLTKGCDDLCRKCPHCSIGICSSLDKTSALDAAVQKICGLSFVDSDSWAALAENVRETLPLVDADSRLGWEPSMDYMADREHLEWKLRQLDNLLNKTLPAYRRTIALCPSIK